MSTPYFSVNPPPPMGLPWSSPTAKSADFTLTYNDKGKIFMVTTGSSTITATLPAAATAGSGWYVILRKVDAGSGGVITSPVTSRLAINGHTSVVYTDGSTYFERDYFGTLDSNGALTISTGNTQSFTLNSGNAVNINAGGTNQNITLTPSGSGFNKLKAGSGNFTAVLEQSGGLSAWGVQVVTGSSPQLRFTDSGGTVSTVLSGANQHLLLGGLTTDGTGVLQFPAATTSAGGITFGTDVGIWRAAANVLRFDTSISGSQATPGQLRLDSSFANSATPTASQLKINLYGTPAAGEGYGFALSNDSGLWIHSTNGSSSGNIKLATAGSIALTLDSSQNATFAGKISLNGVAISSTTYALLPASTTGISTMRIPSGTAPTSPVSGDLWYDGTNLKFRDGSTTRTLTWV